MFKLIEMYTLIMCPFFIYPLHFREVGGGGEEKAYKGNGKKYLRTKWKYDERGSSGSRNVLGLGEYFVGSQLYLLISCVILGVS